MLMNFTPIPQPTPKHQCGGSHCFLGMVHGVYAWAALLCLSRPFFTAVSEDSREGHISPVTYRIESWISAVEGHQSVFAKLLPQEVLLRVSNWLGRSRACPLSWGMVTSPSGMGHFTKSVFWQQLLLEECEWRPFPMTTSLQITFHTCPL